MSQFKGPADSPGFLLWRLTLGWQRALAVVLEPLGLTHVQFVLLACAYWMQAHDELPNQLALARRAGTDVKMTSEVVRRLEAKGLLTRRVDAADTRARLIGVTREGAELARNAIERVERADGDFFAGLPAGLVAALRESAPADV